MRTLVSCLLVIGLVAPALAAPARPRPAARPMPIAAGLLAAGEAANRASAAKELAAWKAPAPTDPGPTMWKAALVPGLGTLMLTGSLQAGWKAAWPQVLTDVGVLGLAILPVGPAIVAARAAFGLGGLAASHGFFGAWSAYGRVAEHDAGRRAAAASRRAGLARTVAWLDRLAKERGSALEAGLADARAFERRHRYAEALARLDGLVAPLPAHPRVGAQRRRLEALAAAQARQLAAAEARRKARNDKALADLGGLAVAGGKAAVGAVGWVFNGLRWLDDQYDKNGKNGKK